MNIKYLLILVTALFFSPFYTFHSNAREGVYNIKVEKPQEPSPEILEYVKEFKANTKYKKILPDIEIEAFNEKSVSTAEKFSEASRILYLEKVLLPSLAAHPESDEEKLKQLKKALADFSYFARGEYSSVSQKNKYKANEAIKEIKKLTNNSYFYKAIHYHYLCLNIGKTKLKEFEDIFKHPNFTKLSPLLRLRIFNGYSGKLRALRKADPMRKKIDLAVECLNNKSYLDPKYHDAFVEYLLNSALLSEYAYPENRKQLNRILHHPNLSPADSKFLEGTVCLREGWNARGSGTANQVTQQGWRIFRAKSAEARKLLTESYKLKPSPFVASIMVSVAMGDGGQDEEEWLELALSQMIDMHGAICSCAHAYKPEWGGSLNHLYYLALRCAKSERYDTNLPRKFFHILHSVLEMGVTSSRYFKDTEIAQVSVDIYSNYLLLEKNPHKYTQYVENLGCCYWLNGEYAKAAKALSLISKEGPEHARAFGMLTTSHKDLLSYTALGKDSHLLTALDTEYGRYMAYSREAIKIAKQIKEHPKFNEKIISKKHNSAIKSALYQEQVYEAAKNKTSVPAYISQSKYFDKETSSIKVTEQFREIPSYNYRLPDAFSTSFEFKLNSDRTTARGVGFQLYEIEAVRKHPDGNFRAIKCIVFNKNEKGNLVVEMHKSTDMELLLKKWETEIPFKNSFNKVKLTIKDAKLTFQFNDQIAFENFDISTAKWSEGYRAWESWKTYKAGAWQIGVIYKRPVKFTRKMLRFEIKNWHHTPLSENFNLSLRQKKPR